MLKVGETVKLVYVDQNRKFNPNNTAWQEISGGQEQIKVNWATYGEEMRKLGEVLRELDRRP